MRPTPHAQREQSDQPAVSSRTQHDTAFGIVKVQAHLGCSWRAALPILRFLIGGDQAGPTTTLVLQVVDQAELVGIVNRLHGLGLPLISVEFLAATDGNEDASILYAVPDDAADDGATNDGTNQDSSADRAEWNEREE